MTAIVGWTGALLVACPALLAAISLLAEAARLRSADAMADTAGRFLASLTPAQRAKAAIPFESEQRFDWGYTPRSRRGIPLKELRPDQRKLADELLRSGLSAPGYRKAQDVLRLESVLREIQGPFRDPELYYFTIFGTPSASSDAAWGWRVEGHHLSLNYTVRGGVAANSLLRGAVAATPSFFGAHPAQVRNGPLRGLRALAGEEDIARQLLWSLDPPRRKRAVLANTAPADIVTGNAARVDPLAPAGIPAGDLTAPQLALLRQLLDEHLSRMPEDLRQDRLAKLDAAGTEKVFFAWAGGAEPGEPHYYRLQGPTFLIEYDDTQDGANHIHTVWRDFAGDFGRDLLREHYRAAHGVAATPGTAARHPSGATRDQPPLRTTSRDRDTSG